MQSQLVSESDILYEDNHLIAVNKKAGILVQGDETGDEALSESLKVFLKKKYNKSGNVFAGVIHRIDRPVSGLVLFAKTSKALARMNELFKTRAVQKTYFCLVEGRVADTSGHLLSFLKKDEIKNKSFSGPKEGNGFKRAELDFEVQSYLDHYTFLKIEPLTGRHHQIRAQLAGIGHVIKGDLKYGAKRSNRDASISLHSASLRFVHPVQKTEIIIQAPLPETVEWKIVGSKGTPDGIKKSS